MKIGNILSDFLYDKNYFITIFENKIHIYKYIKINKLQTNEIILKLETFNLVISGNELSIIQMNKDEILITGIINNIGINYE